MSVFCCFCCHQVVRNSSSAGLSKCMLKINSWLNVGATIHLDLKKIWPDLKMFLCNVIHSVIADLWVISKVVSRQLMHPSEPRRQGEFYTQGCFPLQSKQLARRQTHRELKSFRQKGGSRLEFSSLLRGTTAVYVLAFVLLTVKQSSSPLATSQPL